MSVEYITPKNRSGFIPRFGSVPTIKRKHYKVLPDVDVHGDQPKIFILLYDSPYSEGQKRLKMTQTRTWPKYIVKSSLKWYPNESITEHLLNQIGSLLGMNMAHSILARIGSGNQIRFFSKIFLQRMEQLNHCSEIYAGYLNVSENAVLNTKVPQEKFTVQFTEEVLLRMYPKVGPQLVRDFCKLLVFDAYVGNTDRHFQNFAVISSIESTTPPRFSPTYDTARGLWWNFPDQRVKGIVGRKSNTRDHQIRAYCDRSEPRVGWDGVGKLNHLELLQKLVTTSPFVEKSWIAEHFCDQNLKKCVNLVQSDYRELFSEERRFLIVETLQMRHRLFWRAVENTYERQT